jgi:hypothetical protein
MHFSVLLPLLLFPLDVTLCLVSDSGTSNTLTGSTVETNPTAVAEVHETREDHKSLEDHSVVRRDIGKYNVLAQDGTNITDTEEFLKSKIEGGKGLYQVFSGEDVIAWGNVTLTPEAKAEVESHKGVRAVSKSKEVYFWRALPSGESIVYVHGNVGVAKKDTRLHTRADPWRKQLTDDDGLKMISQYP